LEWGTAIAGAAARLLMLLAELDYHGHVTPRRESPMVIYGSSLSPFVRKTLAYVAEKGLKVDLKPIGLGNADPDFVACSPFRKMPAFRDGDFAISDSSAIITYLEAKFPEPVLIPSEAKSRARTIWFEEFADTILAACLGKMFFNRIVAPRFLGREGDLAVAEKAQKDEMPPLIDYIEGVLPDSGFLVDDRLTLADLAVASPFVNLLHMGIALDAGQHPKTASFVARLHHRASYAPLIAKETAFFNRKAS
jgi:glutathione S-transferase